MNSVVSKLKLGNKLGEGHFGEVFLGEDSVHGVVAVKVLGRKNEHSDEEWVALKRGFLAEAQHLSKATHQNVVQVHGIEELEDCIQFSMAYCPGGSLQTIHEAGPMTLVSVRKVAAEVLLGLGALHHREMLHRDIKPGNILLDAAGVAKLGDFGLVTDDLLLGYGSAAGYADHIAFEVWQGGPTSAKSDIWALGMTLFRLLHGQTWYFLENEIPEDTIKLGNFVERLCWLPHVPKQWRRVVRKMMSDDTVGRYQNAGEALNAISMLPIEPEWTIPLVTPNLIRWEKSSPKRLNVVEWKLHSERRHEWEAWSEPLGEGRRKRLGSSTGVIGRRQVERELETYFTSWN
jgi:serine/threonine-protein kinase